MADRIGAVDIGTNTVRLLVAEHRRRGLPGHSPLIALDRRVDIVRLGQGVDATGSFAPEAVERALAVLEGYGEALRAWRPDRIQVVATSASRDVDNGAAFLDGAQLALGTRPVVIDGTVEAALAFAGVRSAHVASGPLVVVDLGGGSTEFVHGDDVVAGSVSVDIGSVRLTERLLGDGPHDVATIEAACRHVDELFAEVTVPAAPVVGVAGTYTTLAAVHLGLAEHDSSIVDGAVLTMDDLESLVMRLAEMSTHDIEALGPVVGRRAPVLTAGAVVAWRALAATGASSLAISEADLLDGVGLWAAGAIDPTTRRR